MTAFVVKDAKVLFDERNISGILNQVGFDYSNDLQEDTTLDSGTRSRVAGLNMAEVTHQGFWDVNDDSNFFGNIGDSAEHTVTVIPNNAGDEGVRAFFMTSKQASYNQGASIGEIFSFDVTAMSQGALVKGKVSQDGTETASGEGTVLNLGAVTAGSTLYAALHVLSASGSTPTLDVTIDSDSAVGFGDSPETQITFDQFTAAGSQFASVAGAITDTFFRAEFTLGGSSPEFEFVVVIGISDK